MFHGRLYWGVIVCFFAIVDIATGGSSDRVSAGDLAPIPLKEKDTTVTLNLRQLIVLESSLPLNCGLAKVPPGEKLPYGITANPFVSKDRGFIEGIVGEDLRGFDIKSVTEALFVVYTSANPSDETGVRAFSFADAANAAHAAELLQNTGCLIFRKGNILALVWTDCDGPDPACDAVVEHLKAVMGEPIGKSLLSVSNVSAAKQPLTIVLVQYRGPEAQVSAQRLEKTLTDQGLPDVFVVKGMGQASVCVGHFDFSENAKADDMLKRVRAIRNTEGRFPFYGVQLGAIPEEIPENPWPLEDAKGSYTLHIASWEAPGRAVRAQAYAADLRSQGYEAYVYHGPRFSMVTLGTYGPDIFVAPAEVGREGVTPRIVSAVVLDLLKKFPRMRLEGELTPPEAQVQTQLVKIPNRGQGGIGLVPSPPVIAGASGEETEKPLSSQGKAPAVDAQQQKARPKGDPYQTLLKAIHSNDPSLQAMAAETFLKTKRAPPLDDLKSLVDGADPRVRTLAVALLGYIRPSEERSLLQQKLRDADANVRLAAAFGLAVLGDGSQGKVFLDGLTSPDVVVRRTAAWFLGLMGNPSVIDVLKIKLEDPDAVVVLRAAEALWCLGSREGLERVRKLMEHDNHQIKRCAIELLGRMGDASDLRRLRELSLGSFSDVTISAITASSRLGDTEQIGFVLNLLEAEKAGDRIMAAYELGESAYVPAIDHLEIMLAKPSLLEQTVGAASIARILFDCPSAPVPKTDARSSPHQAEVRVEQAERAGNGISAESGKALPGTSEQMIFVIDKNAEPYSYVFSPDLTRVACVVKDGQTQCVVVNGKKEEAHNEVLWTSLTFSEDAKHLAYWAKDEGKWRVIRDGEGDKLYDGFIQGQVNAPDRLSRQFSIKIWHATTLAFSPDGNHLAYNATDGSNYFAVVDDKEQAKYDGIGINSPSFSPDGQQVAYQAWRGKKAIVVVAEKEYGGYDSHAQRGVVFSPDGKRWAIIVWRSERPRILLDGVEGPAMEEISAFTFSEDGKHFAYLCKKAKGEAKAVVDGVSGSNYDDVWCPRFSSKGKLAFFSRKGEREFLVLDGTEGQAYKRAGRQESWFFGASYPTFSPDGDRIAYVASEGEGECAVIDGKAGKVYKSVWEPGWSLDGQHTAYVAFRPKGPKATTSPASGVSRDEDTEAVVVWDGQEGETLDSVKGLVFSPDSKHLVFVATKGDKQYVVIDGKRGQEYELIPHGGEPQFVDGMTIRYLAVNDGKIYLMECEVR